MAEVTITAQANFAGCSQVFPQGRDDDARKEISIGNATLRSFKVPHGLGVRLSEHSHCQGRCIAIKEDIPVRRQFWHDRPSSLIVDGKAEQPSIIQAVLIFAHAHHVGNSQILPKSKYDTAPIRSSENTLRSAPWPGHGVARACDASLGERAGATEGQP